MVQFRENPLQARFHTRVKNKDAAPGVYYPASAIFFFCALAGPSPLAPIMRGLICVRAGGHPPSQEYGDASHLTGTANNRLMPNNAYFINYFACGF